MKIIRASLQFIYWVPVALYGLIQSWCWWLPVHRRKRENKQDYEKHGMVTPKTQQKLEDYIRKDTEGRIQLNERLGKLESQVSKDAADQVQLTGILKKLECHVMKDTESQMQLAERLKKLESQVSKNETDLKFRLEMSAVVNDLDARLKKKEDSRELYEKLNQLDEKRKNLEGQVNKDTEVRVQLAERLRKLEDCVNKNDDGWKFRTNISTRMKELEDRIKKDAEDENVLARRLTKLEDRISKEHKGAELIKRSKILEDQRKMKEDACKSKASLTARMKELESRLAKIEEDRKFAIVMSKKPYSF